MGDGVRGGKENHYSIELDCITQDQAPSQPRAAPHPSHSLLCCWPSCSPPSGGPELVGHTSQPRAVPTPHLSTHLHGRGQQLPDQRPLGQQRLSGAAGLGYRPVPTHSFTSPAGGRKDDPKADCVAAAPSTKPSSSLSLYSLLTLRRGLCDVCRVLGE